MTVPVIEKRILDLVDRIAALLSPADLDEIRSYVCDVGEYGVAVDLLVGILATGRLPVPDDALPGLLALAKEMGVDERGVQMLRTESSGDRATGDGVYRSRQFPGFPNASLFAGVWSFDDVAEGARAVVEENRESASEHTRGRWSLIHGSHTSRSMAPRHLELGVLVDKETREVLAAFPRVPPPPEFLRPEPPYYTKLRTEVLALLDRVGARLPSNDVAAARELALVAGEYGFAVEWIAATVSDCGVHLSPEEVTQLEHLALSLGISLDIEGDEKP